MVGRHGLDSYSLSVICHHKRRAPGHESAFVADDGILEKSHHQRRRSCRSVIRSCLFNSLTSIPPAHEGHVPDISTREGFLDLCALGNLVIYLPAFSGRKDRHWIDLRFAVAQYWELASWANQRLALTGLHNTGEVYEAHVAFKLSALQFGQALIDYHEAIKKPHLYGHH